MHRDRLSEAFTSLVSRLEKSAKVIEHDLNSKHPPRKLSDIYPAKKNLHPSRPGREACMNYMRFGSCKFGIQCKYDHPKRVKNTDELLEEEMMNDRRYSENKSDATRLADARYIQSKITYISSVIDTIFEESSKDKKSGKRFIPLEISHAILEAVLHLFQFGIKTLFEDVDGSWRRYGYTVHLLCVNLPNLGQAVVMVMKHAGLEESLIDDLNECFESVRDNFIRMENKTYHNGFQFELAKENTLKWTEMSILKNAYQHSTAMAEAATERVKALNEVKKVLSQIEFFNLKGIELHVDPFGSCANTVGTLKSDLDLIVSFRKNDRILENADEIGCLNEDIMSMFMEALGLDEDAVGDKEDSEDEKELFRLKDYRPQARVPVIKFFYKPLNLELDLILFHSNDYALLNTQLIRDYCKADPRVRPLEFALKRWVSARGVGDSTNSTPSSYCWMLMMIFYLQQVDKRTLTPVAPDDTQTPRFLENLQGEDEDGSENYKLRSQPTLTNIYEEVMSTMPYDASGQWLEGSIESLDGPQYGALPLLLLGFFLYYGTEAERAFGLYDNIVSLRKGCTVPKPHVMREWKLHKDHFNNSAAHLDVNAIVDDRLNGEGEGAGQSSVFKTPSKEDKGNDAMTLSIADLEKQLEKTKLGDSEETDNEVGKEKAEDEEGQAPKETVISPPTRSPRSVPSTHVPFNFKVTPSKMRELLEKPAINKPRAIGVFPDVLESAKQWQMSIEDPFELNHDLGSVVRSVIGQNHVRSELRRAICVLSEGLSLPEVTKAKALELSSLQDTADLPTLFDILCAPNVDVPQLPFLCGLCGQSGHREKQCALFICHRCGLQGHTVKECSSEAPMETCYLCKKPGHLRKDCPLKGKKNSNDVRSRNNKSSGSNRGNTPSGKGGRSQKNK